MRRGRYRARDGSCGARCATGVGGAREAARSEDPLCHAAPSSGGRRFELVRGFPMTQATPSAQPGGREQTPQGGTAGLRRRQTRFFAASPAKGVRRGAGRGAKSVETQGRSEGGRYPGRVCRRARASKPGPRSIPGSDLPTARRAGAAAWGLRFSARCAPRARRRSNAKTPPEGPGGVSGIGHSGTVARRS